MEEIFEFPLDGLLLVTFGPRIFRNRIAPWFWWCLGRFLFLPFFLSLQAAFAFCRV